MSRYGDPVTVATILNRWVNTRPADIALVDPRTRMSYRELGHRVDAVASGLAGRGILKGDRVGLCLPNGATSVILFLAIARLGAVFVGIHPALKPPERRRLEGDAELSLLVTARGAPKGAAATLEIDPFAAGADVAADDRRGLDTEVTSDDVLAIAYTSGTTPFGRPVVPEV